jgi:hypothetical protein
MVARTVEIDDDFAESPGLHQRMCGVDICRGKALFVEQRSELAAVGQCCRLPQTVMRLALVVAGIGQVLCLSERAVPQRPRIARALKTSIRSPYRAANTSILPPTLIPRILGYRLTFFNKNGLFRRARESSFRYDFDFAFFGFVFFRLFVL